MTSFPETLWWNEGFFAIEIRYYTYGNRTLRLVAFEDSKKIRSRKSVSMKMFIQTALRYSAFPGDGLSSKCVSNSRASMKTRSKVYETSGSTNPTDGPNDSRKRQLSNADIASTESHITSMVCYMSLRVCSIEILDIWAHIHTEKLAWVSSACLI
jgi:hypothetical protein